MATMTVPRRPLRMHNRVLDYAWGSRSLLAELRGESASSSPEAEQWMGAHPAAPSAVLIDGVERRLDVLVRDEPVVTGRHGRVAFLLKLLAAEEPLSLQAHPTKARAEEGFARENAEGISLDDPTRSYKDDNHKPELICAITPFRALSGFRAIDETIELLESLRCPELRHFIDALAADPAASTAIQLVEEILALDDEAGTTLGSAVAAAVAGDGPFPAERAVARRIAQIHPNDPGIVIALMLELVELAPGEAIYLGAGRLHAYVDGLGVEIMAASDNVLRGGLTPKHVDVEELIEVLVPRIEPIEVLRGDLADDGERVYRTPAPEFELSRVDLDGRITRTAAGPEILVVTAGNCRIGDIEVGPTDSCFVPDGVTWTAEGSGQLFRARTP